ncbi:glycosyltransferase family 2 protein [Pseudomonas sp. P2498]|uniref:Glycosyltransferase family 2 protein n=2 Tax=Pseudomonas petrae TaxID=2912190 RepID=A0ABS9ICE2_9PSED|nr:glycosyltransferase family 2 protein [Pseudomonas petrae]MCF7534705.1 glycosyltransferase family 2 protein [Pseudomonas petrae]MCF7539103.1 glycosyltransferase family 2 protein [Pseudomonas petrae]MCF7545390.1 glycosyltransferase family 2 protein [Pseudomonas petrae]MCF7557859.1 glycosyltransferase family 2 protein [Pseudomonas petrae]
MCTFNGARFLREQLDSFEAQSFTDWVLYISDDGSTDTTLQIIHEYQHRWGTRRLIRLDGPRTGFAQNFLSLIRRNEIDADYFAFSDQDDIWFSDKLGRALSVLRDMAPDTPNLYCSRTRLINDIGGVIGHSPLFDKPPSFRNALVQSLAGANTMLINDSARQLMAQVPPSTCVVAHDWLTYLVVSGCGGEVQYDAQPSLDYRQHGNNLIGSQSTWRERVRRLGGLWSGQRQAWTDANLYVLEIINAPLTLESRATLMHFERGRSLRLPTRLYEIRKSGVYRQTLAGSLSLYLAACMGKV